MLSPPTSSLASAAATLHVGCFGAKSGQFPIGTTLADTAWIGNQNVADIGTDVPVDS